MRSVQIVTYNPTWPQEFQAMADRLRQALGPQALRIDHIGSTSIPGMPAKDVIDVQVSVAALEPQVMAAVTSLGYVHRTDRTDDPPPNSQGVGSLWTKWLFLPPPGQRPTHLHVRLQGAPNQRYALLFRDYVRAHPLVAEAYANLKRGLAENLRDPDSYPEVKEPAVHLIFLAADDWAADTGWAPGPSDG